SLVNGTGDTDNTSFTVDASGNLKTAASFDFETKATYSIRVRVTDSIGLFLDKVFTVSVTDINDAPVLNASLTPALTPIPRGATSPAGDPVASLLSGAVTGPDTEALSGIAVVGLTDAASGTWQYSLDTGATWQPVGAVADTAALLLRGTDLLRFVPTGP